MKKTKATPAVVRTVFGTTLSIDDPIRGTRAYDKPYPGVMLYRYAPGSMRFANLIRPANPGPIIYTNYCGGYEEVLLKAGTGFYATIEPPWFKIGKLTVKVAYMQISNMCKALDDVGVYWMIRCEDSRLARKLFNRHNITIWQTPNRKVLIITNYEDSDTPAEHRPIPSSKHIIINKDDLSTTVDL